MCKILATSLSWKIRCSEPQNSGGRLIIVPWATSRQFHIGDGLWQGEEVYQPLAPFWTQASRSMKVAVLGELCFFLLEPVHNLPRKTGSKNVTHVITLYQSVTTFFAVQVACMDVCLLQPLEYTFTHNIEQILMLLNGFTKQLYHWQVYCML